MTVVVGYSSSHDGKVQPELYYQAFQPLRCTSLSREPLYLLDSNAQRDQHLQVRQIKVNIMSAEKEKIDLVKDLSGLLDKQLITKEEFEIQKRVLLTPSSKADAWFEKISLFFRLFTWQVFFLIVLVIFYLPIRSILSNASEVGVGDFKFRVQQSLNIGNPGLAETLKKLSKNEIITLLSVGEDSRGLVYNDSSSKEISLDTGYEYYTQLQTKGLFIADEDLKKVQQMLESKKFIREDALTYSRVGNVKRRFYSFDQFTKEELEKLQSLSGRLSKDGERVYWIIVDVAGDQLSRAN